MSEWQTILAAVLSAWACFVSIFAGSEKTNFGFEIAAVAFALWTASVVVMLL